MKLLRSSILELYVKRPTLLIVCAAVGFLFVSTSVYAAYKAVYSGHSQTIAVDAQKPKHEQTTTKPAPSISESVTKEEDKKNDPRKKLAHSSSPQSPSISSKVPAASNQPNNTPTSSVPPYYGAILPPTVTKTDNGTTMTYTISLTIIPNETFGNPMIRLQLFHPGVCINNSELTRIYRYNNQNTLSMGCVIDKSQPAYGMTNLNLDFSIYKDNGEAIYGAASGWTHVLPENYNQ